MMYSNSREFGATSSLKTETLTVHWAALFIMPGVFLLLFLLPALLPLDAQWSRWLLIPQQWPWWHFAVIYMAAGLLTIPRTLIAISAGFFLGLKAGMIAAFSGWLIASLAAYMIGFYLAGKLLPHFLFINSNFKIIQQQAQKHGFKTALLCRLLPVFPLGWSSYALGSMKAGFMDYLGGSLLGSLPLTLAYVGLGQSVRVAGILLSGAPLDLGMKAYAPLVMTILMLAAAVTFGVHFKSQFGPAAR